MKFYTILENQANFGMGFMMLVLHHTSMRKFIQGHSRLCAFEELV